MPALWWVWVCKAMAAVGRPKEDHNVSGVDKAKDKAQVAKGEVKSRLGHASGDQRLETEGKADKVSGNLKQAGEKLKDAIKR